jgi:hypothetical protein
MMEIDFERMKVVRESNKRRLGRTFTAAWDAIEGLQRNPGNLVWNIPDVRWADHILQWYIVPICKHKGLREKPERHHGGLKVVITGPETDQYVGAIYFSHYRDTGYDFRGVDFRPVEDYGELALYLGRRVLSENR